MSEFFRPWRRKIGCVTLLLACLFAVGWVRSLSQCDELNFTIPSHFNRVISKGGYIAWGQFFMIHETEFPRIVSGWTSFANDKSSISSAVNEWGVAVSEQIGRFGFAFKEGDVGIYGEIVPGILVIPYWSIVILLTPLSAFLLLSKPHPSKTAEPEGSDGSIMDFFRGWRRRVEVVTLLLTCVLIAGWVWSYVISDFVNINLQTSRYQLRSVFGTLQFSRITPSLNRKQSLIGWKSYPTASVVALKIDAAGKRLPDWEDGCKVEWRREFHGLAICTATRENVRFETIRLPYWFIVTPLTFLPFWLLLSKPHKSNQKKNAEPISVGGT